MSSISCQAASDHYFALGEEGFNLWPRFALGGVLILVCDGVDCTERRFMTIVPFLMASSTSKRFLPGTQPSSWACFQDAPSLRTPMMTFNPLSRAFNPCPCLH